MFPADMNRGCGKRPASDIKYWLIINAQFVHNDLISRTESLS